jgi:protein gp37
MSDWVCEKFRNLYPRNAEEFKLRLAVKDADKALARASQNHIILTLTKNYPRFASRVRAEINLDYAWRSHFWFGVTICSEENALEFARSIKQNKFGYPQNAKIWISFEPLLGEIKRETLEAIGTVGQIVIGAQTRPVVIPDLSWIQTILEFAKTHRIPVFIKDNLYHEYMLGLTRQNLRELAWAKSSI